MSVVVNLTGQPVQVSVGQRNAPGGAASLLDVNRVVTVAGTRTIKQDASLSVAAGVVTGAVSIRASGSDGLALINSTGTTVATIGAGPGTGTTFAGGVNAAAITSTSASGVTTLQAATQDAVRILGRAGGTASRTLTITTAALGANRTVTFPDASITVAGSASALTSGRVPFVTTGGLLTDSAEVTYSSSALRIGTAAISSPADATTYLQISSSSAVAPSLSVYHLDGGNNTRSFFAAVSATGKTLIANTGSTGINGFTFRIGTTDRLDITSAQAVFSVTGGVTVPNGTAAAPGIRLTSEAHGLYRIGAASVGVSVAGALVLTVGSTASSFASGTTLAVSNTTASTSTTTGALTVAGGVGVAGAVYAGSTISTVGSVIGASIVSGTGRSDLVANDESCWFYRTNGSGLGDFALAGHLIIQPRTTTGSGRSVIVLTGSTTPTERLRIAAGGTVTIGGDPGGTGLLRVNGGINLASGNGLRINNIQVVGAQGAAVADAGAGSGTATNGGWGFTSEAEFNAFITAFNAMKDSYNAALSRLRAHGLIAT